MPLHLRVTAAPDSRKPPQTNRILVPVGRQEIAERVAAALRQFHARATKE